MPTSKQTPKEPKAVSFSPKTESDQLALEIARAFNEEYRLPMYRHFCRTIDIRTVRYLFQKVQSLSDEKIKKSKPALFIYLLKKYAKTEK